MKYVLVYNLEEEGYYMEKYLTIAYDPDSYRDTSDKALYSGGNNIRQLNIIKDIDQAIRDLPGTKDQIDAAIRAIPITKDEAMQYIESLYKSHVSSDKSFEETLGNYVEIWKRGQELSKKCFESEVCREAAAQFAASSLTTKRALAYNQTPAYEIANSALALPFITEQMWYYSAFNYNAITDISQFWLTSQDILAMTKPTMQQLGVCVQLMASSNFSRLNLITVAHIRMALVLTESQGSNDLTSYAFYGMLIQKMLKNEETREFTLACTRGWINE